MDLSERVFKGVKGSLLSTPFRQNNKPLVRSALNLSLHISSHTYTLDSHLHGLHYMTYVSSFDQGKTIRDALADNVKHPITSEKAVSTFNSALALPMTVGRNNGD